MLRGSPADCWVWLQGEGETGQVLMTEGVSYSTLTSWHGKKPDSATLCCGSWMQLSKNWGRGGGSPHAVGAPPPIAGEGGPGIFNRHLSPCSLA